MKFSVILAVVVAICAYLYSLSPLVARHWFVLVTFGKFPGVKPFGPECDAVSTPIIPKEKSSKFGKRAHCFNATGDLFWHDAGHNETLMRQILTKALDDHCPVLIYRPFKDHKCDQRLRELAVERPDLNVRVKINRDDIMDGIKLWPESTFDNEVKNRDAVKQSLKSLLEEYEQGYSQKFIHFDATFTIAEYERLWDTDLSWLRGTSSSSFLSNYNRTIHSTPFHSAFTESIAYQCEGTKKWFLMTPEDALPTHRIMNLFTVMKDCNGRKDLLDLVFSFDTTPDTMFYFPPYWAHSVETKQGYSSMFNYRVVDIARTFRNNPMTGIHAFSGLWWYGFFFKNYEPDEVAHYYRTGAFPVVRAQMESRKRTWGTDHPGIIRRIYAIFEALEGQINKT